MDNSKSLCETICPLKDCCPHAHEKRFACRGAGKSPNVASENVVTDPAILAIEKAAVIKKARKKTKKAKKKALIRQTLQAAKLDDAVNKEKIGRNNRGRNRGKNKIKRRRSSPTREACL